MSLDSDELLDTAQPDVKFELSFEHGFYKGDTTFQELRRTGVFTLLAR